MKKVNLNIQRLYFVIITVTLLIQLHYSVLLQYDDYEAFFALYPLAFIMGVNHILYSAIHVVLKGLKSVYLKHLIVAVPVAVIYFSLAAYEDAIGLDWFSFIPQILATIPVAGLAFYFMHLTFLDNKKYVTTAHHVFDL